MDMDTDAQGGHVDIIEKPVWFITGCSTGFGRYLAEYLLDRGYCVVVTARNLESISDFASNNAALTLKLDLTNQSQVEAAIKAVESKFGHIDVLVNNAGVGYIGAIEESEEGVVRRMFDVNLFGLSRMIHAVLPNMRKRHKGLIINFSSIAGLQGFPSIGYYSATKFAVEGLSESLWQEVEPLGLKVMLVEPSGFRTDWFRSARESKRQIEDYAITVGALRDPLRRNTQPGDPARAAMAIVRAVESGNPPHRLLLGNDAFEIAMAKLEDEHRDFSAWETASRSADFPRQEYGHASGAH
jgi:NADP-dependent 3-hydroxy acid dehydrogenase YdfG